MEKSIQIFSEFNPEYDLSKNFREKFWNMNAYLFDNRVIKYVDTDSQFLVIPRVKPDNTPKLIKTVEDLYYITCRLIDVAYNTANYEPKFDEPPLIEYTFKNEFQKDVILFYGKKAYLGLNSDDDELLITGLEGKKGTYQLVADMLSDFAKLIKSFIQKQEILNLYESFEKVLDILFVYFDKLETYVNKWNQKQDLVEVIEQLGLPVNISKSLNELKVVSSFYKGTVAFDVIFPFFETGGKGKSRYLFVLPKSETIRLKIVQKLSKYVKTLKEVKDLTIPEEFLANKEALEELTKYFDINVSEYKRLIVMKLIRFIKPIVSAYHFSYLELLTKTDSSKELMPILAVDDKGLHFDYKSKKIFANKVLTPDNRLRFKVSVFQKMKKGDLKTLIDELEKVYFEVYDADKVREFQEYQLNFKDLNEYSQEFTDYLDEVYSSDDYEANIDDLMTKAFELFEVK